MERIVYNSASLDIVGKCCGIMLQHHNPCTMHKEFCGPDPRAPQVRWLTSQHEHAAPLPTLFLFAGAKDEEILAKARSEAAQVAGYCAPLPVAGPTRFHLPAGQVAELYALTRNTGLPH